MIWTQISIVRVQIDNHLWTDVFYKHMHMRKTCLCMYCSLHVEYVKII